MISVILIEPETPGNIGAIARAMKNFGLKDLVIVNPRCDYLDIEAIKRAKYAKDVLKKAKIKKKFSDLKGFHTLVGTTSKLGTDYNLSRLPITPEQLSSAIPKSKNIGIIFGREGIGLVNKEIEKCDVVVTIPTSPKYPVMNLSHSATILFYELFKSSKSKKIGEHITIASEVEKKQILKMIDKILDQITFSTKEKKETQKLVWKRIVNKSFLTKRESFAIMGFFRKLIK